VSTRLQERRQSAPDPAFEPLSPAFRRHAALRAGDVRFEQPLLDQLGVSALCAIIMISLLR
jgi:hypothetical protein